MRCSPLCSRVKLKEEERKKKRKRVVTVRGTLGEAPNHTAI